jgi:hypothetical protein
MPVRRCYATFLALAKDGKDREGMMHVRMSIQIVASGVA